MNSRLLELIRRGVPPALLHDQMVLHGKGGSAPPAPDYIGAAEATGDASKESVTQQNWANRPAQFTPWGSSTWQTQAQIDPSTNTPVTAWTQEQKLSPAVQSSLDSQLSLQTGRSDLAQQGLGRVAQDFATPFDWTNLPGVASTPQAGQVPNQTTKSLSAPEFAEQRDSYTKAATDYMRPEWQRTEDAARTRLANQGFTAGSEGYNTELERISRNEQADKWKAMEQGGAEQERMNRQLLAQQGQDFGQQAGITGQNFNQQTEQFNLQNQLRQQAIAEQAQQRNMSLNETNALMSGQQVQPASMPSFMTSSGSQAPNLLGAAQAQGQYGMGLYNADQQAQAGLYSGLGQLGGSAAMLYAMGAFSDIRLKSNIVKVGEHPIGVGIYEYDLFGKRQRGVMAQELLEVAPELVLVHPSGYLMVNYGGLNG